MNDKHLTLGSLFDGIGGFPLAGKMAGITPVWSSEIEPFPIRVTEKRLPEVRHYGDVHGLNGREMEPVDIITFGSPCQDLSIAGRREGLSGSRSNLFYEAVRIIREMREKTNGKHPRWAVWENVPGALSSSKGRDFNAVLKSLIRIKEPTANVPMPDKGKWLSAGEIMADTCSLAWRIIDAAEGWGVAQRRKRIFAVLDLDGQCAGKVLFESEGLSGYTPPGSQTKDSIAQCAARDTGGAKSGNLSDTLEGTAIQYNPTDSRIKLLQDGKCQTLCSRMGTGGNNVPLTLQSRNCGDSAAQKAATYSIQGSLIGREERNGPRGTGINQDVSFTLNTVDRHAVCAMRSKELIGYVVRRLTPEECCRLQGFPDGWCENLETDTPTDDEIDYWHAVFDDYRLAVTDMRKPKTRKQIENWLRNPHSDSAKYKALGNSVAVPCVVFVLAGIVWAQEEELL